MKLIMTQIAMKFWQNIQEKRRLMDYCPNIRMGTMFMDTVESKTYEPHKLLLTCCKV